MTQFRKKLPILSPFFIALVVLHSLFVDYTVQFPDFISSESSETNLETIKPKVIAENGVIGRISYLESFLVEIESKESTVLRTYDIIETKIGKEVYAAISRKPEKEEKIPTEKNKFL